MLASEFGWSIEYILNMSKPQIRVVMDGLAEVNRMKNGTRNNGSSASSLSDNTQRTSAKNPKDTLLELMSIPGVKIGQKAKEMLDKLSEQKE